MQRPSTFILLSIFYLFCHALAWAGTFSIGSADGSFETGLAGTTTSGDVRRHAMLGSLRPSQGQQAVVLTTAPDDGAERLHADTSVLRFDPMSIPAATSQLRLDYVFLTNERTPSYTNDRFAVTLVIIAGGEEILLHVDTFDPQYPAPWTGYARQTGFRTLQADLSAYAGSGETVGLELRLHDVGDGRGDSAVFVDNVQLTAPAEPLACVNSVYQVLSTGDTLFADGSCSTDSDDLIVEYRWDLGDGGERIGRFIEHTYSTDGIYQATLTVKDETGNTSTSAFHVVVGDANHAPQIVSSPIVLAANDTPYRYNVLANDPEVVFGDVLTFALTEAPAGMRIESANGTISWTPSASDARQNPVTVTVTDSLGRSDSQTFTLIVDAAVDIVASDDLGQLYTARSNGDGSFADYRLIGDIGRHTRGAALADFDRDGDVDLLTGSAQGDSLILFYLEKQSGHFAAPIPIASLGDSNTPAGDFLLDMAAADFNNDGNPDAILNSNGPHSWLLLNQGQGAFDISLLPGTSGNGRGLDAADINGDGHLDIARGRCCDGLVELYLGDGTGQFSPGTPVDAGSDPYGVVLADLDTDGVIDLLTQSTGTDALFYRGNGDGTFQPAVSVPSIDTRNNAAFAAVDLNQDGAADLVAVDDTFNHVWFYPGNGDATFGPRSLIGVTSGNTLGIAAPAGRVIGQPVSLIGIDTDTVNTGGSVAFDATGSYDDGNIIDYHWDFGDGNTASGATASHLYSNEGVYQVVLTITDDDGHLDRRSQRIVVNGAPPIADAGGPYAVSEADAIHGKWPVALDGNASGDAESGVSYAWDVDASDGIGTDATEPSPHHVYTAPGVYTVTLTVTDSVGQTATDTTSVTVTAGATPVAALSAPALLDESAAAFGSWRMRADVSGTTDDLAIATYTVDWGDNTQTTISALRDSFADGDLDSNPTWTANGGTWHVINGELRQSDTSSGWKWLQAPPTNHRDFILQLDVQGVSSGGQIGIVFHNTDPSGNTDTFLLSSADSDDSWRFTNWSSNTVLAEGGNGWDPGIWYHLRLVVSGTTVQLLVTPEGGSEALQLTATVPGHAGGGIGLLANAQAVIFDNVQVTPTGNSLQPMHLYTAAGDYTLTLTATDHAAQSASASVTTHVIANAPPIANAGGSYVLTEADAHGSTWVFSPNASASSDDYGIFDYRWDFGDGSSGSGVNPTHIYTTPGTYTVTLTVTDHAGQQTTTTTTVDVTAGSPPIADAGGPYVFGEAVASLGVWTASFDASGSSDDVGIDRYEWWLAASDAFTGTAIDSNIWQASPGVTQDDAVTITGISPWGQRYLFSTEAHHRIFQAQVRPANLPGYQFGMWGLRRADASDFSFTGMPYAIYFHSSDIQVYEDGIARGSFAPYTRGELYDIRITVKPGGAGALYEFKHAAAADWTLLYDSDHPSNVPLQVGGTVVSGTFVVDNVQRTRVYSDPTLSLSYTIPGVHDLTLKVWDRAGQPASDATTFTIAPGTPPVANTGGPYILLHDRLVAFSSAASSDDAGIMRYHWDFGDGSATYNPNPVHLYATPDTYTATLTVTDHALQTTSATTTVQPGQVSQIDSAGLSGDWQTLEIEGTLSAQIDNPGTADMGPFTVIFFEDLDGDGRFDAASDTLLGSVSQPTLAAGAAVQVRAAASGTVRFRQPVISAFLDSGAPGDLSDVAHYGDSRQACTLAPLAGQFNPVVEWQWSGDPIEPASDGVIMAPAVIDLTDDGIPDVVFASVTSIYFSSGLLRAINGADGSPIFTVTDPAVYGIGQLAVGDIDLDGRPEIVAVDHLGTGLVAFEHDGTVKWQSPSLAPSINWGAPSIADLDHDGTPEIVVGATVVDADGSLRWSGTLGQGDHPIGLGPLSLVADLDLQGGAEVVAGNTAYHADGTVYWHNASLGDGFNAVGNFDLDPFPEIVLVSAGKAYLLGHDGTLVWGPVVLPGGSSYSGAPTVADMDGDGEPEIGVATAGAYTVLETDGTLKWSQTIQDFSSSVTGSSVFDFEGDGRAEVVYGDETTLRIFRGSDGTVLWEAPSLSSTGYELPVIVDVDADGQAEIIKVSDYDAQGAGIQVFGNANQSWVGTRQLWNQHTYHVTNINNDGRIPQHETPSWQTHNSYRRNLLTIGDALRFADLTASYVRINVQGGVAQATVRIGNGGAFAAPAGVPVAFFDGDPGAGGTLLGTVATTTGLEPNAYEDVSLAIGVETANPLWVVVDASDTVTECDEANNRHNSGLLVQLNQPPVAETGGPYTAQEGVALSLDGSGSSDPDGDVLTYAWDLDNDGAFDDASDAAPQVTFPDNGTYTIALQVSDGNETDTDSVTVTVSNVAPVVLTGPDQHMIEGASLSLAPVVYTDVGQTDTHTATIDWGDGVIENGAIIAASSSGTVHGTHLYDDNGTFPVTVCVTDQDGATGCSDLEVTVGNSQPVVTIDTTDTVALYPGGSSFFVRRAGVSQTYSATGFDAGSDDLIFSWSWGDGDAMSQHTHFNNGSSTDGRPPSNRGAIAPYSAIDTAYHTYTTPGTYTPSVHLVDDDLADNGQPPTTASILTLITDEQDCSMTFGFWQHQFDPATTKPQVNASRRQAYLSLLNGASSVFSELFPASTSAEAWDLLQPEDTHATTKQRQAIKQALAAWLNFAWGAVGWDATIPGLGRPFNQVMAEIETVLLSADSSAADDVRANDLAVAVNEMDAKNKDCKKR